MSTQFEQDILTRILETKRKELAAKRFTEPDGQFRRSGRLSLRQALLDSETGIIAEFKRKSPSRGWIHEDARPEEVIPSYAAAGAAALSILTDEEYFGGSLDFIRRVRGVVNIPILRKDFIISPVQLEEAARAGADAVLLIASCLTPGDCASLTAKAHDLGLEVLLEIHSTEELDYITPDIDVVGVNNRHLGSFVTDVKTSFDLAAQLKKISASRPESTVFISESGLSDPATVKKLRSVGYRGFLMGENFMKQDSPAGALAEFIREL